MTRLRTLLAECRDDPDRFNTEVLARPPYWEGQRRICQEIVRRYMVVAPCGNMVGKSYCAAGIILWWLLTRPKSLVIASAPSQTLLATVLFKELREAHMSMVNVGGWPVAARMTTSPNVSPQSYRLNEAGWQALGIATNSIERSMGQHAKDLLVVVDEASGILPETWRAIRTLGARRMLIIGNPLQPDTDFHKAYLRGMDGDPTVASIRIPSHESPDWNQEKSSRGMADQTFAADMRASYGVGSAPWQVHVEALFPENATQQLLDPGWVSAAFGEKFKPVPNGVRIMGVDLGIGSGGDWSVIVVRDANGVLHFEATNTQDVNAIAARMAMLRREYVVEKIIYDAQGPGQSFHLVLAGKGISDGIAYFGSASGGARSATMRSASAWAMRERFDPSLIRQPFSMERCRAHQGRFEKELLALRYSTDGSWNRIKLETKDELKRRLGMSPDFVDALIMSFSVDVPR